MTASEAQKLAEENKSVDIVKDKIDDIDYWIGIAAKNGRSKYIWLVSEEWTDDDVDKVASHFRGLGYEVVKDVGFLRIYTFLW